MYKSKFGYKTILTTHYPIGGLNNIDVKVRVLLFDKMKTKRAYMIKWSSQSEKSPLEWTAADTLTHYHYNKHTLINHYNFTILLCKKYLEIPVIAHEVTHVILNLHRFEHNWISEEQLCALSTILMANIMDNLNDQGWEVCSYQDHKI